MKIDADGTPKYYVTNKYVPICGHWFWDNNNGAKSICQKLGYSNGALSRTNQAYTEDAVMLGRCKSGEDAQHCSEDCRRNSGAEKFVGKVFQGCADCTAGQRVGIKISCTGLTAGTEIFEKTCRGKKCGDYFQKFWNFIDEFICMNNYIITFLCLTD